MASSSVSVLQIIVALFLPPVAVAMHEGITSRFWVCLVLTILFFLPGMVYAIYVITR